MKGRKVQSYNMEVEKDIAEQSETVRALGACNLLGSIYFHAAS